jgi:hypothetical protein
MTPFAKYLYRSRDVKHPGEGIKGRGHSNTQLISVYLKPRISLSRHNKAFSDPYQGTPFARQYTFGGCNADEAYWPSPLIRDFISHFQLGKKKLIVDPFIGSGRMALCAAKSDDVVFIGYEISTRACEHIQKRAKGVTLKVVR